MCILYYEIFEIFNFRNWCIEKFDKGIGKYIKFYFYLIGLEYSLFFVMKELYFFVEFDVRNFVIKKYMIK